MSRLERALAGAHLPGMLAAATTPQTDGLPALIESGTAGAAFPAPPCPVLLEVL